MPGGAYVRATGLLKKIEEIRRRLPPTDGTVIPLEGLFDLEREPFEEIQDEL